MSLLHSNGVTTPEGTKLSNTLFEAMEPIFREYISKGKDPTEIRTIVQGLVESLLWCLYQETHSRKESN